MRYLARETVELVLNEGSDLKDFLDSCSEENIVDSGEEFVPVDLEVDSSDSDNNIFIFIIRIHATSRIKLFFLLCLDSSCFAVMTLWIIYLTSTHPKLSKTVHVSCIIPSSLFTTIYFKQVKTVHLQELSASFCGVLNELTNAQHK